MLESALRIQRSGQYLILQRGVEEMPLQNGNMNGENCWLNQHSYITCLSYCFTTRGRNNNTHLLTDHLKYAGPWASPSFMSSNPRDTLLDPSVRHLVPSVIFLVFLFTACHVHYTVSRMGQAVTSILFTAVSSVPRLGPGTY